MQDPTNLKDKILQEIRSGQLSMRPRIFFVLQVAALIAVALATLVVSVFILNFILFSIRLNRADMLLSFGPGGWLAFLQFFPWTLLVLDMLLVAVLQWLVRKFKFGYRMPALYMLAALLMLTVIAGALVDRATPFNDRLFEMRRGLPSPVRDLYDGARDHDIDDTLRQFGILPGLDYDDMPAATTAPRQ